jgi:hypothetical protein
VQLPVEALREGELLLVGEALLAEHEYRVFVHRGADFVERSAVVGLAQVDAFGLGGEEGVKAAER